MTTFDNKKGFVSRCRVYLFTYRRPQLLKRAINSLISQTYVDWVCEVHNDDPADVRPDAVLAEFDDPRITLVTHPENYGPTKSFNCAFVPVSEQFVSILEDDNSWDPEFLASCIDCLIEKPNASLVWANMQMWKQISESECVPTATLFWPQADKAGKPLPTTLAFGWPNRRSFLGGLHSNGAMVMSAQYVAEYGIPDNCPFNLIEQIRERTFRYPIVLLRRKLANWTLTTTTARPSNFGQTTAVQIFLATSFLACNHERRFSMLRIWQRSRRRNQRTTIILVLAILSKPELWHLLRFSRPSDYFWCFVDLCKQPLGYPSALFYCWKLRNLGDFLRTKTMECFDRSVAQVGGSPPKCSSH
jgi:hypothetical protein